MTSPDLLCGELGRKDGFAHMTKTLGIDGKLHLRPTHSGALDAGDAVDLAGRRVPCVSVHDGEIGLLDNIGSILGVRQVPKAVVKFSKSGTPKHVYEYHGLHGDGIVTACGQALAETALEQVTLHPDAVQMLRRQGSNELPGWKELWPDPV